MVHIVFDDGEQDAASTEKQKLMGHVNKKRKTKLSKKCSWPKRCPQKNKNGGRNKIAHTFTYNENELMTRFDGFWIMRKAVEKLNQMKAQLEEQQLEPKVMKIKLTAAKRAAHKDLRITLIKNQKEKNLEQKCKVNSGELVLSENSIKSLSLKSHKKGKEMVTENSETSDLAMINIGSEEKIGKGRKKQKKMSSDNNNQCLNIKIHKGKKGVTPDNGEANDLAMIYVNSEEIIGSISGKKQKRKNSENNSQCLDIKRCKKGKEVTLENGKDSNKSMFNVIGQEKIDKCRKKQKRKKSETKSPENDDEDKEKIPQQDGISELLPEPRNAVEHTLPKMKSKKKMKRLSGLKAEFVEMGGVTLSHDGTTVNQIKDTKSKQITMQKESIKCTSTSQSNKAVPLKFEENYFMTQFDGSWVKRTAVSGLNLLKTEQLQCIYSERKNGNTKDELTKEEQQSYQRRMKRKIRTEYRRLRRELINQERK